MLLFLAKLEAGVEDMKLNEKERRELFMRLCWAGCEAEVDEVLGNYAGLCSDPTHWRPLGREK